MTIIEDIPNKNIPFTTSVDQGMTNNNWTVKPRVVQKWKNLEDVVVTPENCREYHYCLDLCFVLLSCKSMLCFIYYQIINAYVLKKWFFI